MSGPRVLLTTIDLGAEGGVASYLRAVRPYFTSPVDFLYVGARPGVPRSKLATIRRIVDDTWHFWRAVRSGEYALAHLNPSLNRKSLIRDGMLALLARLGGLPVVVFLHGWVPSCERALLQRPVLGRLFGWTILRADHIVVLAHDFAERLRLMGYRGAVSVLSTAVENQLFETARQPSECVALRVLFLARLEREKGALTAVEAVQQLRQAGRPVRLTIVGDGSDAAEIRKRAGELPDVQILGYLRGEEKISVLRDNDVYLFPTEYGEGMPISVLEAMAVGLPVITRPVGGLRDFFVDGTMGYLTESTEPAVFAGLLERLTEDRRREMGSYNAAYARRHFTGQVAAAKVEAVYRCVLRARS
jgi:glycosyltransferase involved in cell wall biosynthesis